MSIILNFVLGSGMLGMLIFYSSKRRKAAAEASMAENDNRHQEQSIQHASIEFLSSQLHEAWGEVEKMQELINAKREQIISLVQQTKQLEIELIEQTSLRRKAELSQCFKIECTQRLTSTTK